ncbi:MAG TPA: prolyl oligopeptidase family serine peptidase [Usitatibacter sp.]|nr:prolyl oligopeptidase family serine peptidase [Usitatibacter sp.]
MTGRPITALTLFALVAVVGYAAAMLLTWAFQEKLLFYPRAVAAPPAAPPGWKLEEVRLRMADGITLAGVLVAPPAAKPPLVVYFGGNAEEVTAFASTAADTYGARAVLLVNYRGYGDSAGSPSEKALVSDGIAIVDWAARRADIDASRIAIHGRSLGTGVAVQVASARPPRCVLLTSPFASALEVAQAHYPWLPVAQLIRHPFDSAGRAPGLRMPLLVLIGDADTLVPPSHSERLAGLWGGPVERLVLHGYGHNDLSVDPRYDAAIHAFLDRSL